MIRQLAGLLLFLGVLVLDVYADESKGEKLVNEAWEHWNANEQQTVEKKFQQAIAEDAGNKRAYIGLSLLYAMQDKNEEAWAAYRSIIDLEENYQPYLFAASASGRMNQVEDKKAAGILDVWEQLTTANNNNGYMRALAWSALGDHLVTARKLGESIEAYNQIGAITQWLVIGPFDNVSGSGYQNVFPPENEFAPAAIYEGKNGIPAGWFELVAVRPDRWVDFTRYFAQDDAIFYANNFIHSDKQQRVQLRVGTSGSLKAFLNDQLILAYEDENNNDLDTYIAETELQKGWNRLLIKTGHSEINQNNFMVRITDSGGDPLSGLRISVANQAWPRMPAAPVKGIPNFAENYFKKKIEDNPAHLENYILLSECYLRNDKAIEGELILREAMKRSPNCAIIQIQLVEAYIRGEKYDEFTTAYDRIYALDSRIPQIIEYKISEYFSNEQIAEAEGQIRQLEELIPGSPKLNQYWLALYEKKGLTDKVIETSSQGYEQFPTNWDIAVQAASVSIQTSRSYERAIEIYEKFLEQTYGITQLYRLAYTYLQAANVAKWQEIYDRIFEIDPAATAYYFQMANIYFSLQDYPAAEATALKLIELCPTSTDYWEKLADIQRAAGKITEARQSFVNALKYYPPNYDARDHIREIDNKPPVYSRFDSPDVAAIIQESAAVETQADDNAVILLNNVQRIVYEKGASEMAEELIVKLFNSTGIEEFKEYRISYNPYNEELVVERAVTVKPDGSEIKADTDRNHIVFKSLEPGDVIYMRWKIKNYYSGKLSNHFWDSFYFNAYYPYKDIRYSLLVPNGYEFDYGTQNMDQKPKISESEDGVIYQWQLRDEPAIQYEYGMPILDDVGKVLHISSIKNWQFMVDWYRDVAQTRTKPSYEIRERVRELFANRPDATDEEKIETIYNFITENITYSYVPFRQSALVPQKARDVLVNKMGDCKDVSTLAIAMLKEVGVDAHYVLINTRDEGSNQHILPSIAFNHCITGVETSKGIRYMDLTASNYPFGSVPTMDLEGFSLPIKPDSHEPFPLPAKSFISRSMYRLGKVIIHADNGVEIEREGYRTGALAASMRNSYRNMAQSSRETSLIESLSSDFPAVKLKHFELSGLSEPNEPVHFSYSFSAPDFVSDAGSFKIMKLPWTDIANADRALSYEQRHYPYQMWPEADSLREELVIQLPKGMQPIDLGKSVKLSNPAADYELTLSFKEGAIHATRQLVYKKSMVMPDEYSDYKMFYNAVVKADNRQILLKDSD